MFQHVFDTHCWEWQLTTWQVVVQEWGRFPVLLLPFLQGSPVGLKLQICTNVLWFKSRLAVKRNQHHGVSREGLPRQNRLSQTGGPENHVGHPGQIHLAAVDRLRSLRDSVVSLPRDGCATSAALTRKVPHSKCQLIYIFVYFTPIILHAYHVVCS